MPRAHVDATITHGEADTPRGKPFQACALPTELPRHGDPTTTIFLTCQDDIVTAFGMKLENISMVIDFSLYSTQAPSPSFGT
jgi:hypothetical protein